jgi:hypothetical protein
MASPFVEVEVLRGPEGVIVPVTYRWRDGRPELSFSAAKEFDRNGAVERTAYLKRHHFAGLMELLGKLPTVFDLIEDRVRAERRAERDR